MALKGSSGTVAVAGVYTSVGIDAAITNTGVLSINGEATVDGASPMSSAVAIGGGQYLLLRAGDTSAGGGIPPVIGSLASGNEAIMTLIIVLLKIMQWLSRNRSPGLMGETQLACYMSSSFRWFSTGKSSMTSIAI